MSHARCKESRIEGTQQDNTPRQVQGNGIIGQRLLPVHSMYVLTDRKACKTRYIRPVLLSSSQKLTSHASEINIYIKNFRTADYL